MRLGKSEALTLRYDPLERNGGNGADCSWI
jgi:hypothetical protein